MRRPPRRSRRRPLARRSPRTSTSFSSGHNERVMKATVLRSLVCVSLAGAVSLASACHRRQGEAAADAAPAESVVHGIVSVTGTPFEQQLMLSRSAGSGSLRLQASPADSAALVRVGGAEAAVRGDLEGQSLNVHGFTVTRVGNAPVV